MKYVAIRTTLYMLARTRVRTQINQISWFNCQFKILDQIKKIRIIIYSPENLAQLTTRNTLFGIWYVYCVLNLCTNFVH